MIRTNQIQVVKPLRLLTTKTRQRVEEILSRLERGKEVSLEERIQLKKFAMHIPFIAGKLNQAIKKRQFLESQNFM